MIRRQRRWVLVIVGLLIAAPCVYAQTLPDQRRVGVLIDSNRGDSEFLRTLAVRLGANGFVEGRDIRLDVLSCELDLSQIPRLAKDMVARRPSVIVTTHEIWVDVLRSLTSDIPIVFSSVTNPVERGYVRSLSRSGTNIVGIVDLAHEMTIKRMELLKEAYPSAHRLLAIGAIKHFTLREIEDYKSAALQLGWQLVIADISDTPVKDALSIADRSKPDAILPLGGLDVRPGERAVATLNEYAAKRRLPVLYSSEEVAEAGGLMSLTINPRDNMNRTAEMVAVILKGAKPAEMPIEQPTKFELIVNLKTAKRIGIKIPSPILARASRIIE